MIYLGFFLGGKTFGLLKEQQRQKLEEINQVRTRVCLLHRLTAPPPGGFERNNEHAYTWLGIGLVREREATLMIQGSYI